MTAKTDELLVTCRKVFPALEWYRHGSSCDDDSYLSIHGTMYGCTICVRQGRGVPCVQLFYGNSWKFWCETGDVEADLLTCKQAMQQQSEALTKACGTDATAAQVAELTAEVERLRGLVESAYCEGFAAGNSLPRCDGAELWDCSNARAALKGETK